MKSRIVFHRLAERDLNNIYEFIAADNPAAAIRYTRRLKARCEGLANMPERGAQCSDLGAGIRMLSFEGRVAVAYRLDDATVLILRLLYAGQNYPEEWPEAD